MNDKFYSYGKQTIEQDDIDAVVEVLKSDWLTQGPKVLEFENALSEKFKTKYVSAVANGTAGLHLIGLALGWQKNDIIITSPITFLASANCILYNNATPDFVDIDKNYYTIDVNKLEEKIKSYRDQEKNIKAVVAVDYAGLPCDWKSLRTLANKYEFQLVNDNCHALGATYNSDFSYAVKFADAVNLSFHPVKHITTGEGGAVFTNNEELDKKIKMLRTHGVTKDEKLMEKNEGPWYYEMIEIGFNYRITDMQSALGINQLKKLDSFIKKRREIAKHYDNVFSNEEKFIIPEVNDNVEHAYHLYPLQIKFEELEINRKEYFEKLKERNILLQVHYIPVHLQPFYRNNFKFKEGDFAVAEKFYQREVSIPIYPLLEDKDLEYIAENLKEFAK